MTLRTVDLDFESHGDEVRRGERGHVTAFVRRIVGASVTRLGSAQRILPPLREATAWERPR